MDEQETLTAPQIAEMCGVTPKTVHRWIKAGHFPGAHKGLGKTSPYYVPKDQVEAFIARMSPELEKQWQRQSRDKDQSRDVARLADQLDHPSQRAVLAALTETLHQFEKDQASDLFALIVEDDPDAGDIFEFTLKAAGFAPVVAKSGRKALALMASVMPDIIILDLHLPDIPGTEVLQQVRSNPRLTGVPVIVATAHPQMAERIQDQADLVLIKPVRYNVLQDKAVELTRS